MISEDASENCSIVTIFHTRWQTLQFKNIQNFTVFFDNRTRCNHHKFTIVIEPYSFI